MWLGLQFIIDIEVLEIRDVVLVLNFDARMFIEWPVGFFLSAPASEVNPAA